jgi:HPt (histidine-containing phosphotransfer) domain-containing protein
LKLDEKQGDGMIIDTSALEAYREVMGEEADSFIADIIDTYLKNAPLLLNAMQEGLAQNDIKSFIRAAHTLKSNSATVGARALASLAAEIEGQGNSGDLNGINVKVAQAMEEFIRVQAALKP